MHGRKKKILSTEELNGILKKAKLVSKLVETGLEIKASNSTNIYDSLEVTANILRNLTDFYTLWNTRREVISTMVDLQHSITSNNPNNVENKVENVKLVMKELQLTQECITKNPKSYNAWHHRLWIIQNFKVDYNMELNLCRDFLKEDQRNFHCWCYRRYVVEISKTLGEYS